MLRAWVVTAVLAVVLAIPRVSSASPPDSDVGVAINFASEHYRRAADMAAAGIRWVRTDLAWSHVEQEPGRYDFSAWDRMVAALQPHGIRSLLILTYGNRHYEEGFPPQTEAGRTAFAAFAGAAARHFRGRVSWEIWNEPNVPAFWVGAPDPDAYVALARAAAEAVRREDPQAWILGPAIGGGTFDRVYLEATFRAGLLRIVDAVSIHPYGASHPEAARPIYDDVRELMRTYTPGRTLPLVVSEWGYGADGLGTRGQADYLLRALTVNRDAGIALTIWYDWQEPVLPWNSHGLMDLRGRPKPAYEVLRAYQASRR